MDYKNVHNNIITCKYAYQSYQHLMIQIKTALRLGRYDREHLINCINNFDSYIIDTCPVMDKFKKKYEKKYQGKTRIIVKSLFLLFFEEDLYNSIFVV